MEESGASRASLDPGSGGGSLGCSIWKVHSGRQGLAARRGLEKLGGGENTYPKYMRIPGVKQIRSAYASISLTVKAGYIQPADASLILSKLLLTPNELHRSHRE